MNKQILDLKYDLVGRGESLKIFTDNMEKKLCKWRDETNEKKWLYTALWYKTWNFRE